jgi:hypothetical protein
MCSTINLFISITLIKFFFCFGDVFSEFHDVFFKIVPLTVIIFIIIIWLD